MSEETHLIIFEYEPIGRNREPVHISTYDIRGILSDGSALRILQSFPPPHDNISSNLLEYTWSEFKRMYLKRPGFMKATCLVQVHSLAPQDSEIVAGLKERLAETEEEVIYLNEPQTEEKEEEVLNTYTFINSMGKKCGSILSKEEPLVGNKNDNLHSEFEKFLMKPLHVPRIIRRGEHEYDVLFAYNLTGSVSHYNTEYSDRIIAKGYKTRRNKGKKSRRIVRGKGKKTRGKKLRQWIKY
jgi:hypothetical protein